MVSIARVEASGVSHSRQDNAMNHLQKNLKFFMGDLSATAFAPRAGVSQPTISRILRDGNWSPESETIEKLASALKVSVSDLLNTDLTPGRHESSTFQPLKSGLVHIRQLDGFELPSGGLLGRHDAFDHLDVKEEWFRFHVATDPKHTAFAWMRDDSMTGEIELGDAVIFNTRAIDFEEAGDGIYAFTYFGINRINHVQVLRKGAYLFTGTKRTLNSIMAEGKELEGLKVHGKAVTALKVARL